MRLKYRIPLIIIALMLVGTLFIGSSYAYWQYNIAQTTENRIETGCFQVEFIDDTSSSIHLENAYPIADEKGKTLTPYIFKIKNNCTVDAKYTLYLNTLKIEAPQTKLADSLIKYHLEKNGAVATTKLLSTNTNINTDYFAFTGDNDMGEIVTSYEIDKGTLKGKTSAEANDGEEATYSLRLWIDASATKEIGGQLFKAAIHSAAYATDLSEKTNTTE